MLKKKSREIIEKNRPHGWVLEPDAKTLMKQHGLDVPDAVLTASFKEAQRFLEKSGGPVVAKAVSKKIVHKTEHRAVAVGIATGEELEREMNRLKQLDGCENVLVEEMVEGTEIFIGAKNDVQFGPVIIFGIGGTSVEIYNDTAIRMAPLTPEDVTSMAESLQASEIISGHRGREGVNMEALQNMLVTFSRLIMKLKDDMASADLNPVIFTKDRAVIADARIILTS